MNLPVPGFSGNVGVNEICPLSFVTPSNYPPKEAEWTYNVSVALNEIVV
jgi:hypothetical protein